MGWKPTPEQRVEAFMAEAEKAYDRLRAEAVSDPNARHGLTLFKLWQDAGYPVRPVGSPPSSPYPHPAAAEWQPRLVTRAKRALAAQLAAQAIAANQCWRDFI